MVQVVRKFSGIKEKLVSEMTGGGVPGDEIEQKVWLCIHI